MGNGSLATGNLRKIICILIGIISIALGIFCWYKGGFMTVSESYKVDEIPIHNTLYLLDRGDNVRQGFQARDELLTGIDVMLVNTSSESSGEIVVQVLDMWGEVVGEGRRPLAEIESGVFTTVPFQVEMNRELNEEFSVCLFTENATVIPGIVIVPDDEDFEDNLLCYYNEDLVGDSGLIVGFNYGYEKFVGYEYQEKNIIWITAAKIAVILLSGIVGVFVVLRFKKEQIQGIFYDIRISSQLMIIGFLMGGFLFSAVLNKMLTDIPIPIWVYGFIFIPLLLYLWTAYLFIKPDGNGKKEKLPRVDIFVLIIVLICIVTRLPMFSHTQRWDSAVYYSGLHGASVNFDFTFESIWNYFRLASHPTLSYTFFMLIGEFLFPAKVTGVLLVMLFMTAVALVFIYKMFCGYWGHLPRFMAMVFTFVISFIPLFWGTSTYVNVDYTLILFFIYLMYAEYKGQAILMAFWTIALLLNKETGWMIVAGYYMIYLLRQWKKTKGANFGLKVKGIFSNKVVWVILAGLFAVFIYMIFQGGLTGWYGKGTTSSLFASREAIADKGVLVNAFGIYPAYIAHRLAQIFVLNFMWIPTVIIIATAVFVIVTHADGWKRIHNISGMIGALAMFVLFSVVYITAALSRYTIFSTVIVWLLALLLLYYVWGPVISKVKIAGACAFLALLMVIQNFVYIDPISNAVFDRLDAGKGKILSTDMNSAYYGDTLVNSYRYSYLDKLLDKMLAEAGYNENKQIVLWSSSEDQSYISRVHAIPLGWDENKGERVLIDEKAIAEQEMYPLNMVPMEHIQAGLPLSGETILYFLPYYERDEEAYIAALREYYHVSDRKEVSNWGGTLSYYILTQ